MPNWGDKLGAGRDLYATVLPRLLEDIAKAAFRNGQEPKFVFVALTAVGTVVAALGDDQQQAMLSLPPAIVAALGFTGRGAKKIYSWESPALAITPVPDWLRG